MAGDILGGQLALELVGYDKEVAAAMKFALGKTMVCQVAIPRPPTLSPRP